MPRSVRARHRGHLPLDRTLEFMAKYKLELEPEIDVVVIGISSHVNDYRLCWSLNTKLGISLSRRDQDIAAMEPGSKAHFAAFDHQDEETQTSMTLICNRSKEGVLLKELKQADFFLVVGEEGPIAPHEALSMVREAEFVLAAFPIDLQKLRTGHQLFA